MREAEERKCRKYEELGARFSVAVETPGVHGEFTVSEIGRLIIETTEESRETLLLEQRLDLAVQRGNTLSILTVVGGKYDADLGAC